MAMLSQDLHCQGPPADNHLAPVSLNSAHPPPLPQVLDASSQPPNPAPSWLAREAWDHIACLDALPAFKGLAASFEAAASSWEAWFRSAEPEGAELPGEWESRCGELQRLLLVRCLRPDRLQAAAAAFVAGALGRRFVEPPPLDVAEALAGSSPSAPLIFVLSPGVDPSEALRKLAAEKGMGDRFFSVALGQGQARAGAARRGAARPGAGCLGWTSSYLCVCC